MRCPLQRRDREGYSWISAVLMSAFKRYRELFIEYFNLHNIGGVCEISGKEREGPSPLRLKAPHVLLCINVFFWHIGILFSSGRGSFLVLSAPWHTGSPPEHHGASVYPGRRQWHVLWGFKVASPHGEAFRARRAIQAPANPRTG